MQFSLYINQMRAIEWGLNLTQAALFSFLYEAQSWAQESIIGDQSFYWVAKDKILLELPILTDKPDTLKRLMAALESKGLIERITHKNRPHMRLTDLGKTWNKTESEGGEINPYQSQIPTDGKKIPTSNARSKSGKKSPSGREKNPDRSGKKSPSGREKNPPNQYTNDQPTNQITNDQLLTAYPFDDFWDAYGKKIGQKSKLETKWNRLTEQQREQAMKHVPRYVASTPDKKYRKNPETYLNNESWNDEILETANDSNQRPGSGSEPFIPDNSTDWLSEAQQQERARDALWASRSDAGRGDGHSAGSGDGRGADQRPVPAAGGDFPEIPGVVARSEHRDGGQAGVVIDHEG